MNKSTSIIVMLFVAMTTWAEPISKTAALQKAKAFFGEQNKRVEAEARRAPGRDTEENAPYYVFNAQDNQGFVIVSGDDRAVPILGYADEGSFDAENMPENVRSWLQGYADQIASLAKSAVNVVPEKRTAESQPYHAAIPKILKTVWGQDKPFNNDCPLYIYEGTGYPTVTGCVATAIAQIMYHHKYPTAETEAIPGYSYDSNSRSVDGLPATTFDWDDMKTDYSLGYSEAQGSAVAKLLTYCGRSVEMAYGPSSSGSNELNLVKSLTTYFGYDKSIVSLKRDSYTDYEWQELLYGELSAGRPVLYSGRTDANTGHSFVCDGYDGAGKYHFNWGWNGSYNGFYTISALYPETALFPDPTHSGTGAGSGTTGYVFSQSMIINIKPDAGGSTPDLYLCAHEINNQYMDVSDSKMTTHFWNQTGWEGSFDIGYEVTDANDESSIVTQRPANLGNGYYSDRTLSWSTLNLADGTYKVRPVSRQTSATEFRPLVANYYVELTVDGNDFTAELKNEESIDQNSVDEPENGDAKLDFDTEDDSHLYCAGIDVDKENKTIKVKSINASKEYTSYDFTLGILSDDGNSVSNAFGGGYRYYSKIGYGGSGSCIYDLTSLTDGPYKLVPISRVHTGNYSDDWINDLTDGTYVLYDPATDTLEVVDPDAVGIREATKTVADDDAFYTLGGVRVEKPLQKGFYIRGGKKLLVK